MQQNITRLFNGLFLCPNKKLIINMMIHDLQLLLFIGNEKLKKLMKFIDPSNAIFSF